MSRFAQALSRPRTLLLAGLFALAVAGPLGGLSPAASTPAFADDGGTDQIGCWYGDPDPRCRLPQPWQP